MFCRGSWACSTPRMTRGPFDAVERHIEGEIARIVDSPKPIIVGPWLSEVGFEILYWIPLLRWIKERFGLDPERVVVVSRGGTQRWYEGCWSLSGRLRLHLLRPLCRDQRGAMADGAQSKAAVRHALDEDIIAWARERGGYRPM